CSITSCWLSPIPQALLCLVGKNTDYKSNKNRRFIDRVAVSPRLFKLYYSKQSERCTDYMEHFQQDSYRTSLICATTSLMISQQHSSYQAFSYILQKKCATFFSDFPYPYWRIRL